MKRKISVLILSGLMAVLPVSAQLNTATLGGRIYRGSGPVEGATVVAIHQESNTQYYASTGRGGWYQFLDMLPGGPYTVRIHYFEYKPLTVRDLFVFVGQNVLVDADIEAGEAHVRRDEAATSMRLGEDAYGGEPAVSPFIYNLVGHRSYTSVPFDVRQEASLDGVSLLQATPVGSKRFHASLHSFYGSCANAGLSVSSPLQNEDYRLYAGLQYDGMSGFAGSARFDARFDEAHMLDITGGRIPGSDSWASAGFTSSLAGGRASNRIQAGWYGSAELGQFVLSDDLNFAAGCQRMLFGAQLARQNYMLPDSASTRFDFYLQDAVRIGRRLTLAAGVRFSFPFTFSPRISAYCDVLGNGRFVVRGGTAVYGRHGRSSTWKNMAALDFALPADFILSLEGVYAQEWERLFIISPRNRLDSYHEFSVRLERYFADGLWAVACWSTSDGSMRDRLVAGFSYRLPYGDRFATRLAFLCRGCSSVAELSSESVSWSNGFEARLTQDFGFFAAGRDHIVQLTAYAVRPLGITNGQSSGIQFFAGLRYLL